MKFSTREDVEAPAEFVYAQIVDFQSYERQALRRGADVRRLDNADYKVGTSWDVTVTYRGKDRKLRAVVEEMDAPSRLCVGTRSQGLEGQTVIDLVALSPRRTRIAASIDLRPKTLSARLFLHSLKLAKTNLTNRFKRRVSDFGEELEAKFQQSEKT